MLKNFAYLFIGQCETVKVPTGPPGYCRKVGRINVIHPNLEGLDLVVP
jgi:hypothetical protein